MKGLREGRFDFGVTEMLLAGQIAAREGLERRMGAAASCRAIPLVLGLWKGDLTLKRAIVDGLDQARERAATSRRSWRAISASEPAAARAEL